MAAFRGWPVEAVEFYERLEAENTKAFWEANKSTWLESVRAPMEALSAEVADEFGPLHLFRPHRDVRFSKDKTPYKTHLGAVTEGVGGELYYVQLSAGGLFAASGYHQMARDQLARFREAVADERTGPALEAVVADLGRRYDVSSEGLTTAPRGYPRDHPRIALLRLKGVTVSTSWPPGPWLSTRRALSRVVGVWRSAQPLNDWLNAHVGPSTEPPAEP